MGSTTTTNSHRRLSRWVLVDSATFCSLDSTSVRFGLVVMWLLIALFLMCKVIALSSVMCIDDNAVYHTASTHRLLRLDVVL